MSIAERINNTEWSKEIKITIPEDEIKMFCYYKEEKATSVELIHHLLGGPNMDYEAMNLADSFQCFEFCARDLIDFLKETKCEILFFEHRKTSTSNVIAVVTKQEKSRGVREHIVLKCVMRLTILLMPKVGFCRFLDIKGICLFHTFFDIYHNIILKIDAK